jgi:antitoxin (DNA-binding transcriptional repressor) of toxin-antitoxin stability system
MEVPITQFRREIFSLVNQALDGAEVWVTHKGRRFRIVPEKPALRDLSRITPMEVMVDPNFDMNDPAFKAEWLAEMEAEWEKDWADL